MKEQLITFLIYALAGNPEDTNSIRQPRTVIPVSTIVGHVQPAFTYTLPPHSIVVLKLTSRPG